MVPKKKLGAHGLEGLRCDHKTNTYINTWILMGIKISDTQHNTHLLGSLTSDKNLDKRILLGKNGAKWTYFEFVFEIAIIKASCKKYSQVPNF
jgi:hypothetical protein